MNDKRPNWLFDESAQVGVDYNDESLVAEYDEQHEGFRDFDNEAKKIFATLDLSPDSIILDIGCGTGGLTTRFAQMCKHVYAVDISKSMIFQLAHKAKTQGLNNVTMVQSGFLTYKHQGKELDAIIANINLHHLPDFWKQIALCRFFDLLKNGGKLFLADVVFDFDPRSYQKEIEAWVAGMEEHAGSKMANETIIHIRDEFSTWEWIMKGMLERAGFRIDGFFEIMKHIHAYICSK
ncbi:MAG TPA: class I SAM-dependent methyltransferase [Thermodesulfobacteriota bacterium]|nr:class I SAM-dependent methyltransferase [Deltaproteobacteria bacterium]HNR13671.1 class I SAM-dependent methyltransferase [Thermodesulfobacteriota bacterium]